MSDPRRSDDVQVVLSMHPARVQEFAAWLRNNSGVGSRAADCADQIFAQGHGARLVVIDPAANPYHVGTAAWIDWIEEQYLTQTAPPKPDEPTGLGAVVEDAEGVRWTLTMRPPATNEPKASPWCRDHIPASGVKFAEWSEINAVRVLSEGVTS